MFRLRTVGAVVSVISLFIGTGIPLAVSAGAAPALQGMVGTWSCAAHDSAGNVARFTSRNALYGNWLRVDSTYAAKPGQAPATAVTFLGRDDANQRWIITAATEAGQYWVRSSTSNHLDGSKWIDAYPADGATAVLGLPQPGRRWTFQLTQKTGSKIFESNVTCDRM